MINNNTIMPIEVDAESPVSEKPSGSFKGALMQMVRKLKKEKAEVDKQFDASIRALNGWKKEYEVKLAQAEEAIRNRYDSIDAAIDDDVQAVQAELKRKQQEAEDRALDEEIERELGSSV